MRSRSHSSTPVSFFHCAGVRVRRGEVEDGARQKVSAERSRGAAHRRAARRARLVDAVLLPGVPGTPRVAINTGVTTTERDEQKGFASLIKGRGSMYRNPAARDPRPNRPVGDEELLELLTALSMVHRRLDAARTQP
ncbi:TIGR02391 family protein [Streptomyces sp. NPDC046275]|uniref:TIGR02391 family protein n=1 Tax=Streptomyces sp. NPDC046275 TaxID=3157201 RepID=UPI0033E07382